MQLINAVEHEYMKVLPPQFFLISNFRPPGVGHLNVDKRLEALESAISSTLTLFIVNHEGLGNTQ